MALRDIRWSAFYRAIYVALHFIANIRHFQMHQKSKQCNQVYGKIVNIQTLPSTYTRQNKVVKIMIEQGLHC